MKNIKIFLQTLLISLFISSCSSENDKNNEQLKDNTEYLSKIIVSFDKTLDIALDNNHLSNEKLGELFLNEAEKQGVDLITINNNQLRNEVALSNDYINYSNILKNSHQYESKEDYKIALNEKLLEIQDSNISIVEKQNLIDKITFMSLFVDWVGSEFENSNKNSHLFNRSQNTCDGWWDCWGQCVFGIVGGALTGGIEGCGIGAAVGAAVGSLGGVAGAAGGAIIGCAGGGVIGLIGGALTGAAENC